MPSYCLCPLRSTAPSSHRLRLRRDVLVPTLVCLLVWLLALGDRFHADEVLIPEFPNDVLDNLQDYDLRLCEESDPMDDMWDENGEEVITTSSIPEDLWFPFAEQEPCLAGDAFVIPG